MEISNEKQEYFSKLLKRNREDNLYERIEYYFKNFNEFYTTNLGFADLVYNDYWAVIHIEGANFAFSVGMDYNFNIPDVMVISDKFTEKEFTSLINKINNFFRDNRKIELEKDYGHEKRFATLNLDKPLIFKKYTPEIEKEFPCGYINLFNQYFADKESIRVIYTDLR